MDPFFATVCESFFDPFPSMFWGGPDTNVKTKVSYPMRFGWYYRHSTSQNEFWWGGFEPLLTVTDEGLMGMPEEIVHEVGNALNAKGEGAYLD
jgi:hypothetical protein